MKYGSGLSASKIKTYQMCKFKFYLEYVLGIRKPQTWATSNGTIIHETLEKYCLGHKKHWCHELFLRYKKVKPWTMHKDFMTHKKSCLGCELLLNIDEYHGDFFRDLPLVPAVNFFGNACPIIELLRGRDLVQTVIDREDGPLTLKIVDAERVFNLPLGFGVNITGIIDLVLEVEPGMIEIRDWKTGNWLPTYDEALADPQLRLYDVAASILYPQYKTRLLTFDYLKNKEYTFSFTEEEREANKKWIISIAKEIEAEYNCTRTLTFKCKSFCMPSDCEREYPIRLVNIKKLKAEGKI